MHNVKQNPKRNSTAREQGSKNEEEKKKKHWGKFSTAVEKKTRN